MAVAPGSARGYLGGAFDNSNDPRAEPGGLQRLPSMILCPACGSENLDGADECDQCQFSLTDLSLPHASTALEHGLMKDRIEVLKPRPPLTVSPDTPVGE